MKDPYMKELNDRYDDLYADTLATMEKCLPRPIEISVTIDPVHEDHPLRVKVTKVEMVNDELLFHIDGEEWNEQEFRDNVQLGDALAVLEAMYESLGI